MVRFGDSPAGRLPTDFTRPAQYVRAVEPSADEDLPDGPCRALWINDSGEVSVSVVAIKDGNPVTMTILGPGILPVAARAVRVSGTDAESIVALY